MNPFLKILLSCILTSLFFSSCESFEKEKTKMLSFQSENYSKKVGNCPTEEEQCMTVKLTFPVAENGPDSVRNKINSYVSEKNLTLLTFGENEFDAKIELDTAVMELSEEYLDYLEDFENAVGWFFESEGSITYSDSNYISINFEQSNYSGGAHPNSYVSKTIFDTETGEKISLHQIVRDTAGLKKSVEDNFRSQRKIPEDQSLSEAGFWFANEIFRFPHNFGLTDEGMEFHYNPYEVAPYAMGTTTILIPNEIWQSYK